MKILAPNFVFCAKIFWRFDYLTGYLTGQNEKSQSPPNDIKYPTLYALLTKIRVNIMVYDSWLRA